MNRDKHIEEIQAEIISWGENADKTGNYRYNLSEHLVDKGYRKIYDDNQRQCVCYALGCQMAEDLKKKVAREIFEEIEEEINLAIESNYRAKKEHKKHSIIPNYDNFSAMCDGKIYAMRGLLDFIDELKKKYAEGENDVK